MSVLLPQPLQPRVCQFVNVSVLLSQPLQPLKPRVCQLVNVSVLLSQILQPMEPRVCLYVYVSLLLSQPLQPMVCLYMYVTGYSCNHCNKGSGSLYMSLCYSRNQHNQGSGCTCMSPGGSCNHCNHCNQMSACMCMSLGYCWNHCNQRSTCTFMSHCLIFLLLKSWTCQANKKIFILIQLNENQWNYCNHCNRSNIVDQSETTFRELRANSFFKWWCPSIKWNFRFPLWHRWLCWQACHSTVAHWFF